jgi:phage terminase large subunit GpA-like protein
MRQRASRARE